MDISLHLLDILQNSITAGATCIVMERKQQNLPNPLLRLVVSDNGKGMCPCQLQAVQQAISRYPHHRPAGATGHGLPLLAKAAKDTGGKVWIESQHQKGTTVTADFFTEHPLCKPLGGVATTLALCAVTYPTIHFFYRLTVGSQQFVWNSNSLNGKVGLEHYPALVKTFTQAETDLITGQ